MSTETENNKTIDFGAKPKVTPYTNSPTTDSTEKNTYGVSYGTDTEFVVPTDTVALPSEGYYYPEHQASVVIKYMTAEDENILTSTDLIRSGKVLDVLLERKIQDKKLRPTEMLIGDKNAVLFALRSTGYGDDYEVNMTCPKCSAEFETSVKLSELKHKKMTVMPDDNGEFALTLPMMKKSLKFRLLRGSDEDYLAKASERSKKINKNAQVNNLITERYLLQIMEFDGRREKDYISRAISAMPAKDSSVLREYIRQVEPNVDLEHEFNCPSCDNMFVDYIPIGPKLFWPNARI